MKKKLDSRLRGNDGGLVNADLICHPDTPANCFDRVTVMVERDSRAIRLVYIIECRPDQLQLPPFAKPCRADELWRTTCFELFVRRGSVAYDEFNFSPSSQWAAYSFSEYRTGMERLALDTPPTANLWDEDWMVGLSASVGYADESTCIGLSAVIEEKDGTKSYWALAHPEGPPDFHDPACFVLDLPAAG